MKLKSLVRKLACSILPSSEVVVFHHITNSPVIQQSGCLLKYNDFLDFIDKYRKYFSPLDCLVKKREKRKIAITFDDGLEDVYYVAYPLLKKMKIPFAIFIVTDFLDQKGYITTEQLKEMAADGLVTIGSHGKTHAIFPKLKDEEKNIELYDSKEILETLIGRDIVYFAYSHGQCDKETLKKIRKIKLYGYAFSVRSIPLNFLSFNKYRLPRTNVDKTSYEHVIKELDKKYAK